MEQEGWEFALSCLLPPISKSRTDFLLPFLSPSLLDQLL